MKIVHFKFLDSSVRLIVIYNRTSRRQAKDKLRISITGVVSVLCKITISQTIILLGTKVMPYNTMGTPTFILTYLII